MRIERADKRYQPLHLLWLVIEPAVYLRVADKPPVTQRLQRARAYSQLPADLLAREPSFHAPRVAFAPQGATFSESAPNAATIISKVFFSIDTISIFMSFRVCRKGNETAYKTYRFPLKGCLLRRLTGLRSHLPQKSYVSHVVSC